jgi:riboflavin synthase
MFTGIIEATGKVDSVTDQGSGKVFWLSSSISATLKPDQSLSHNGACLTVEEVAGNQHRVTAIEETLSKTDLAHWRVGDTVNLERCLQLNGRVDGHLVQGHVDTTGTCVSVSSKNGSFDYRFSFAPQFASLVIEKGSICINGISLTCYNVTESEFTVSIIPYTYEHTNISFIEKGSIVNLEFDLIGKYIQRSLQLNR